MFDNERQRKLREITGQAVRRYQSIDQALQSRSDSARPGDLYVFPLADELAIQWAVIRIHPDDTSLLFTVPVDDHPFVGTLDVRIPDTEDCGPLVLRCGYGLWLRDSEFEARRRSGVISDTYATRARRILSEMIAGTLDGTALQEETDVDPEYESWMLEVAMAVESLRSSLDHSSLDTPSRPDGESVAGVITFPTDFSRQCPQSLSGDQEAAAEFSLAAASAGIMGAVAAELAATPSTPRLFCQIDVRVSGTLVASCDGSVIDLIYVPCGQERTPDVQVMGEQGQWQSVQWQQSPNGRLYQAFPTLSWRQDQIELKITGDQNITIRRSTE